MRCRRTELTKYTEPRRVVLIKTCNEFKKKKEHKLYRVVRRKELAKYTEVKNIGHHKRYSDLQ